MKRHLPALSALLFLHLVIFARLIFLSPEGVPYASLPYDFATAYSRWLIYIGDAYQSRIVPLWCPYVGGGTPFFINPQSQLYSPLTLIVGTLSGYSHRGAQLQQMAIVLFGGMGAYLLSYTLWRNRWSAFVTAICFNFSSAVFSHFQHMTVINSLALIPWLFWATTITAQLKRVWGFPVLAFFIYFLLTSGYPGVIMMILLWLFAYTLYLFYFNPDPSRMRLHLGLQHAVAWVLGFSLSSVQWYPIIVHYGEFTRSTPLAVDQSLTGGSLLFKHLWGIFFQFMTTTPLPGHDTDYSMRGLYFGALAIPLALAALLFIKDKTTNACLLLSVGAFLMACGGMFFGRITLHILFPVLNLSRFPAADSRTLMVLGLTILAGGGARLLQEKQPTGVQTVILRTCIFLIAVLAIGLFAFRGLVSAESYQNVVINYITAEMMFVALAILSLRLFSGRLLMISMVTLLALELGTCVVANFGSVGAAVEANDYRRMVASRRRNFTPEGADVPRVVQENPAISSPTNRLGSEDSNRGYIEKSFHLSEYNPFRLRRFNRLIDKGFTDWMGNGKRVVALPPGSQPGDYNSFKELIQPVEYTITSYTPNEVGYRLRVDQDSLLVFNEVFFPGWRAMVDGKREPVVEVCGGLRAVQVAGGEHVITMTFKPRSFYWGLVITLFSAVMLLLWVFLIFYRARRSHQAEVK